jgi:hypothetical protein
MVMNTTTITDNKAAIAAFFDSLNQGVLDGSEGWVAYLSPQIIEARGVRSRRRRESGMRVQDLIGEANQVVARLRVVGKHTGTHPRMPEPTSRDCDVEQIWIFTMTNGVTHRPPQWRRDVFKPIQ